MSEKANFERDVIRIYFKCGKSFNQTLRTYHTKKGLKKHTFDHSKVRRIIQKFNKGQFNLQRKPGSGRIPMFPDGDTTVVDAAQELMNSNVHGVTSAKIIAENVGCSKSTAYKYLCKNYFRVTLVFVKRLPNAPWQNWIIFIFSFKW